MLELELCTCACEIVTTEIIHLAIVNFHVLNMFSWRMGYQAIPCRQLAIREPGS